MDEFIINEFLKLKLEDEKTIIYVKNQRLIQCKYLLLYDLNKNIEVSKNKSKNIY